MAGNWLIPNVTPEEQIYWGTDNNSNRVSRWPQPDSNRVDAYFRFPKTFGLYPLPSRIFTYLNLIDTVGPPPDQSIVEYVWWDLEVVAPSHLKFTTDPSPVSGNVFEMEIKYFDVLPVTGQAGEQMKQTIYAGPEWWETISEYGVDPPDHTLFYKWNQQAGLPVPDYSAATHSPLFTWESVQMGSIGVADCFSFPRLVVPPPMGFAEMNGVDSYVKFTTWFPNGTSRFLWEYDIRPTAPVSNVAIRGDSTNGAFFMGHSTATNAVWWNRSVNLSPGLTLGTWQSVRMEHDWSIPGDFYTVWIDGIQVGQNAGTFTPSWFDQIGKVGGAFRGEFELRNIKHTTGSPGTPSVILDFPLQVDACPVVGLPIKGTTFNMALPSCP